MKSPWRLATLACVAASAAGSSNSTVAFVTIATDDYYAQGALVTLHSAALQTRQGKRGNASQRRAAPMLRFVLMVPPPGISRLWRERFEALGVRLVDVPGVPPSAAVRALMEADRRNLASQNLLQILQPVPYGGAFAKVHAWSAELFGEFDKVVLLDGDIVAKKHLFGLLELEPISAAKDLLDAFNYGVVVLRPDRRIHKGLVRLLSKASKREIAKYSTRKRHEAGFGDQALVAGYLSRHHGPINFFEDMRGRPHKGPGAELLSTKYNFVVSYRAQERCDDARERQLIDSAVLVHFANNWLHFSALVEDRDTPGRIDSPRCYWGAFHYWRDVFDHAMAAVDDANASRKLAAGSGGGTPPKRRRAALPKYRPASFQETPASPERVQRNFEAFLEAVPSAARPGRPAPGTPPRAEL